MIAIIVAILSESFLPGNTPLIANLTNPSGFFSLTGFPIESSFHKIVGSNSNKFSFFAFSYNLGISNISSSLASEISANLAAIFHEAAHVLNCFAV